jgi:hypothetical protein
MVKMQLSGVPYKEPGNRPEWPLYHCDGFLFRFDGSLANPPALIQLVSNGRISQPLPPWREGDIVTLTPHINCMWGSAEDTGRCFLDIALRVTCEGREGEMNGMIPDNPNIFGEPDKG